MTWRGSGGVHVGREEKSSRSVHRGRPIWMQLSVPRAGDLEDSKPLAHCENYRLGAIVRLELLENPAHVIPYCLLADAKAVADLLVRQPLSDTRQDVYLSSGQWWCGTLGQGPASTGHKPVTRGL